MAQFSIAQLEALVAIEQGGSERGSRDLDNHVTGPPTPEIRRDIRVDLYNIVCGAGQPITAREITRRLSLTNSPWIRKHLERLVAEGYLVRTEKPYRPGIPKYLYEVAR